ncbi:MAG: hypothetical protein ACJ8R9_01065 [Steroidobacteraceae bacterium]
MLRAIEGYSGRRLAHLALKLSPLVFVRPGELRKAERAHFDLENAEWRIPPRLMSALTDGSLGGSESGRRMSVTKQ